VPVDELARVERAVGWAVVTRAGRYQ